MASEISTTFIYPPERLERPGAREPIGESGGSSFSGELGKALEAVDKLQTDADQQARVVADGGGNLHEMAIAMEKADVAMRLALKVRNKVVDAYNEIMRMPL
jgi:flagellar hook-basal body complex protein FliE